MTIPTVAFLGGSIGGWELVVVGIAVLLLFGPKRLPEIAKTIGKVTAQLRGAAQEFKDQVTKEAEDPPSSPSAMTKREPDRGGPEPVASGDGTKPASTPHEVGPSANPANGDGDHDRAG